MNIRYYWRISVCVFCQCFLMWWNKKKTDIQRSWVPFSYVIFGIWPGRFYPHLNNLNNFWLLHTWEVLDLGCCSGRSGWEKSHGANNKHKWNCLYKQIIICIHLLIRAFTITQNRFSLLDCLSPPCQLVSPLWSVLVKFTVTADVLVISLQGTKPRLFVIFKNNRWLYKLLSAWHSDV